MKSSVLFLILIVFGLLMFGCSKGIKSYSTNNGTNNNGSGGPVELLDCIKMNGTLLPARVETDPSNISYTFVKFMSHPGDFDEANTSLRFFSGIDTNSISTTSSSYVVIYSLTGQTIGSGASGDDIDRPFLDSLLSNLNLTDLTFQVHVGPNARVLKVVLNQGNTTLEQNVSLIPSIDANPNSYATNHPNSLVNIHPLLPYSNLGWTNLQYWRQGNDLCYSNSNLNL